MPLETEENLMHDIIRAAIRNAANRHVRILDLSLICQCKVRRSAERPAQTGPGEPRIITRRSDAAHGQDLPVVRVPKIYVAAPHSRELSVPGGINLIDIRSGKYSAAAAHSMRVAQSEVTPGECIDQ